MNTSEIVTTDALDVVTKKIHDEVGCMPAFPNTVEYFSDGDMVKSTTSSENIIYTKTKLRQIILLDGRVVRLHDIKMGDVFSVYEPDGEFVGSFKAIEDASTNGVMTDSIPTTTVKESLIWGLGAVYRNESELKHE